MKIFITGGAGFIGGYLTDDLVKLGHKVGIYDKYLNFIDKPPYYKRCLELRRKHLKQPNKIYKGDIRHKKNLKNAVANFKPDVIVHLAAIPMARVDDKHLHKMVPINMGGFFNVLEVFENSKARRLVYPSSSMAYGHFKQVPQSEDFMLDPENVYGAAKAAGEYFVKLLKKEWVIIRPTSVYGFTDCANRVTQLLLDAAHLNKPAWVTKGESLDFSYIDDVVDGFIRCITKPKAANQTFNISSGEGRAISEFAKILTRYFPDFEYEVKNVSQQLYRAPMDISKAKRTLGFNPKHDIEKGIGKTLELINKYNFYNL